MLSAIFATMGVILVSSKSERSAGALLRDLAEGVRLRLLGGVRVLAARVDLQLAELSAADRVLGEHAADGLLHGADRVLLEEFRVGDGRETTRVARVTVGLLL